MDTEIITRECGNLVFDWYRRPTWSGRYLNFNSMLPQSYKINTISILAEKIVKLSHHPDFHSKNFNFLIRTLKKKINIHIHLSHILFTKQFPKLIIQSRNKIKTQNISPFHIKKGLFEKIKNCLKKYDSSWERR